MTQSLLEELEKEEEKEAMERLKRKEKKKANKLKHIAGKEGMSVEELKERHKAENEAK